ncbi:MAG TPA: EAL domain-containing protein [Kofleriaceae bacterium]|nr:EAL domain-containing protein [Kofleriaceae bacterium]
MALQPIVNTTTRTLFAQEALVRGPNQEPAGDILAKVNDSNRYSFDQACRVTAVRLAAKLEVSCFLSINFMPNAVYEPERCLRSTVEVAASVGFPLERIIFEFSESERVMDVGFLRFIVEHYHSRGMRTAIDDFGAGYSGLNLLAELQPDFLKLDRGLCHRIDRDHARRVIVRGILQICRELEILPIAEGIETRDEVRCLQDLGLELFQGYYFARPAFEAQAELTLGA